MSQTNQTILDDEDVLKIVLTTNGLTPYNISLVTTMWRSNTLDYVKEKKQSFDLVNTAFWLLRSYARSFYDMDFMPY
jgi:hypothetical protein